MWLQVDTCYQSYNFDEKWTPLSSQFVFTGWEMRHVRLINNFFYQL